MQTTLPCRHIVFLFLFLMQEYRRSFEERQHNEGEKIVYIAEVGDVFWVQKKLWRILFDAEQYTLFLCLYPHGVHILSKWEQNKNRKKVYANVKHLVPTKETSNAMIMLQCICHSINYKCFVCSLSHELKKNNNSTMFLKFFIPLILKLFVILNPSVCITMPYLNIPKNNMGSLRPLWFNNYNKTKNWR